MYLAWVGEGVRIPRSRATNECIYEGVRAHDLSWLVGPRCASRQCARRGRGGTVRHDDRVISKADGYGRKGLFKGWASVIIPTSLAGGVEIADSVKFTTAVLFPRVVMILYGWLRV